MKRLAAALALLAVSCGPKPEVIDLAEIPVLESRVFIRAAPDPEVAILPVTPSRIYASDMTLLGTCPVRGRPGFSAAGNLEIIWCPAGLLLGNKSGTFGLIPGYTIKPGATIDWAQGQPLINVSSGMRGLTTYAGTIGGGVWDPHTFKVWVCSYEFYNTATRNNLGIGWFDSLTGSVHGAWHAGSPTTRWQCADVPGWNCTKSHFDLVMHANKTSEWVVAVPDWWSDTYAPGKHLGSGRRRPAGSNEGADGPALYVWNGDPSIPAGGHQNGVCVLAYPTASGTWQERIKAAEGDDTGTGAAWVDYAGKSALVYCWTKADAAAFNCYDTFGPVCNDVKGWHASTVKSPTGRVCTQGAWATWTPMLYFYDPVELGEVAQGIRQPWEVQPYLSIDVSAAVGWPICDPTAEGPAITSITWNPANRILYALVVDKKSDSPTLILWGLS